MDATSRFKPRAAILLLCAGLWGCQGRLPRSELLGVYRVTYQRGVEALELKADGTYVQSFQYHWGQRLVCSNSWWIEEGDYHTKVVLKGAMVPAVSDLRCWDGKGDAWTTDSYARKRFGRVVIDADEDNGLYLERVQPGTK